MCSCIYTIYTHYTCTTRTNTTSNSTILNRFTDGWNKKTALRIPLLPSPRRRQPGGNRTWVIIPHIWLYYIEPNLHLKQEHLFREMVWESRLFVCRQLYGRTIYICLNVPAYTAIVPISGLRSPSTTSKTYSTSVMKRIIEQTRSSKINAADEIRTEETFCREPLLEKKPHSNIYIYSQKLFYLFEIRV